MENVNKEQRNEWNERRRQQNNDSTKQQQNPRTKQRGRERTKERRHERKHLPLGLVGRTGRTGLGLGLTGTTNIEKNKTKKT